MSGKKKQPSGGVVGNRLVRVFMYIVIIVSVLVLAWILSQVVPKFLEYHESDSVYSQMADMSITKYQQAKPGESDADSFKDALQIDWDAFKDTEIVAWFQMDDISYPIMQHSDDSYYLHHLPDGTYNNGGSLFLLSHSNPLLTDQSGFIYGHNMNNGSMFGKLKNYLNKDCKDHRFYVYLPDGTRHVYQFFSMAKVPQESRAYIWSFESDDTFMDWQEWMLEQSLIETSLSASKDAKYITLSTCSGYSGTNNRLVVCGQEVKVDQLQQPASWYADYIAKYQQRNEARFKRASDIQSGLEMEQKSRLDALYEEFGGR